MDLQRELNVIKYLLWPYRIVSGNIFIFNSLAYIVDFYLIKITERINEFMSQK